MHAFRQLAVAAALAVTASVAIAQDQPAGPGKTDTLPPAAGTPATKPDAAAKPAKKERRVDAKAKDLLDAYAKKISTPSASVEKSASCLIEWDAAMLGGGTVTIRPSWSKSGGYKCAVELPESVTSMLTPEQVAPIRGMLDTYTGLLTRAFIAGPVGPTDDYDVLFQEEAGKPVALLMPYSDRAELQKQKIWFGEDGLAQKLVVQLKIDPSSPMAAEMAGVDIEIALEHVKRGDRTVVSTSTVTTPLGEFSLATKYADGPGGTPLPTSVEMRSATSPDAEPLRIYDWVLDGKAVESTKKPAAPAETPKPTTPTPAPAPGNPAGTPKGEDAPAAPAK